MKKFYSIVLMATALLIGTNVTAETVSSWDALKSALQAGGQVTLSADINVTADNAATWRGIWMGAVEEDGAAPEAVLDLNGHNITINSGNYKKSGVTKDQALIPFILTKGSLKIVSASPAKIEVVKGQSCLSYSTNVFFVFGGVNQKVDPKGENPFTYLEIGENVTIQTQNGTAIAIDALTTTHTAITGFATSEKPNYGTSGLAYGVRVDVKGSLISQGADGSTKKCYGIKANGNLKTPAADADKMYAPYIHIHPSAVLQSDNRSGLAGSTAVYASGFAQWLIEGNCSGATGVYISSGIVAINDALVKSAADDYIAPGSTGHANGSGSAIVINSRNGYVGEVELTISGDTKAESTSGYAFEEKVNTTSGNTKVEQINIEGGTFVGGAEGAMIVTPKTVAEAEVVVNGGNVSGSAQMGADNLAEYLNAQGGTHTTLITDGSKTILVISEGGAPIEYATVAGHADERVKWTGAAETLSANLKLEELEISGAAAQVLTIADGVTLEVKRVVLGDKAQIIVEAGAKFIVSGTQGIVAPVASNILLRNEDGKRSIFLFNPNVTSNRHPSAKVEFITNSWRNSSTDLQWECFGLPTNDAVSAISCEGSAQAFIAVFENGDWSNIGIIGSSAFDQSKLNKPFAAYDLLANRAQDAAAPKINIEGSLVGNADAGLNAYLRWTPFANSYTGELDLKAFLNVLGRAKYVAQGVYVAEQSGNGHLAWNPVDLQGVMDGDAEILKLAPMQAFMLNNPGTFAEVSELNYANMVWSPAMEAPAGAPRRIAASNNTKVRVLVADAQGVVDKLMLRENADNVYTLEKYMNEDMNIYVLADEKSAIVNAESLNNTYVGFSTVKGGKFTISFANVAGAELTLVDHETGAQVAMAEGNKYEFTAAANSANDYRFEIVESAKLPTAIENTEAVKSVKGIYTITGQFVGEMNVWNTLPAGVYVVNGEKRVK